MNFQVGELVKIERSVFKSSRGIPKVTQILSEGNCRNCYWVLEAKNSISNDYENKKKTYSMSLQLQHNISEYNSDYLSKMD